MDSNMFRPTPRYGHLSFLTVCAVAWCTKIQGDAKGGRQKEFDHLGKSKRGLTNGGLSPKFSEKIGGKSFLGNRAFSGLIGAFSGPVGAFSGLIGTNSSAPHTHGGRAEIAPKGPFLAQLAPFGPSPPLLSPPLDFPKSLSFLFLGLFWSLFGHFF